MMRRPDPAHRQILEEAQRVLTDLEGLETLANDPAGTIAECARAAAADAFRDAARLEQEAPLDAQIEMRVSADELSVRASFYPPSEHGTPLYAAQVEQRLRDSGVVFGIDHRTIADAVERCNSERRASYDVVVARGQAPVPHIPERLELRPDLVERHTAQRSWHRHGQEPCVLVRAGEELAHREPERAGRSGRTVYGREIPFDSLTSADLQPGVNTRWAGDSVVADIDGRFHHEEHRFAVKELRIIDEEYDPEDRLVTDTGDLLVRRKSVHGWALHCDGSIFAPVPLDADDVSAGGDMILDGGVVGRRRSTIRARGTVRASFLEECFLEADGGIEVKTAIVNAAVHTRKQVTMGPAGLISGGVVYAGNGVTTTELGTPGGPGTEIYCGTDYATEQELAWIRNRSVELARELSRIRAHQTAHRHEHGARSLRSRSRRVGAGSPEAEQSPEDLSSAALEKKLRLAIRTLNSAAAKLLFRLDKNEHATVTAYGTVHPGTYIEICHVSHVVRRPRHAVRFALDKEHGRIVAQPLTASMPRAKT
jgi:hypothetical protein